MKNLLQHLDIEQIEELPNRSRIPLGGGHWGRYKGRDYPYNKVQRFLESRIGRNWDDVFSEYVHLDWIKDEDKTREKIGWNVVFDTLMIADKVHFLEEGSGIPKPIADYRYGGSCFYIHPTTKILCFQPKKKSDYRKKMKEEEAKTLRILGDYHQLIKTKGIWHEVRGESVKSDIVEINGLHYRKVKEIPQSESSFNLSFFGRKVVPDKLPYKVVDGYMLVPVQCEYGKEPIGPRDRMISEPSDNSFASRYYFRMKSHDSIKITMNRQLSSKELKKYGLKNDSLPINGERCKVCGGQNCMINHEPTGRYMK